MVDTPVNVTAEVNAGMRITLSDKSVSYLEYKFRKGIESGESEESLRAKYG